MKDLHLSTQSTNTSNFSIKEGWSEFKQLMKDLLLSTSSTNTSSFSIMNSIDQGNSIKNGIPPLPRKKPQSRVFLKKSVSMDPMPIQGEKNGSSIPLSTISGTTASSQQMKSWLTESNVDSCYLTPADPPLYTHDSCFIFSNIDLNSNLKHDSFNSLHNRSNQIFRLDSGVGEGESVQGSGHISHSMSPQSPTSVCSSRVSCHYEDIDQYHKIHQRQQQHDDDDVAHQTLQQRSGTDPTHDPPHTYHQLSTSDVMKSPHKPVMREKSRCWLVVLLIIILLISLLALSLSIYDMISVKQLSSINGTSPELDQTLLHLQQQVNDLIQENKALKTALMTQQKNLSNVEQEVGQLSSRNQNLSYTLDSVKKQFDAEIANLSLGLGFSGGVNFSRCVNQSAGRSSSASATDITQTSYLPSETDIQKYFVTFAYCTYSGATDSYLETQYDEKSTRQRYRCKCWGQVTGMNYTLCTIFVWMCPQVLSVY